MLHAKKNTVQQPAGFEQQLEQQRVEGSFPVLVGTTGGAVVLALVLITDAVLTGITPF